MTYWFWVLPEGAPKKSVRQIIAETAADHRIPVDEMLSERRQRHLVYARQDAMWRIRQQTTFSLPRIGGFFGGMDHTTVLHGIRAHEARLAA